MEYFYLMINHLLLIGPSLLSKFVPCLSFLFLVSKPVEHEITSRALMNGNNGSKPREQRNMFPALRVLE